MPQRTGYIFADHRASPGLTEEIAQKLGMPQGPKFFEADTLTCAHCKTVQVKNPLRTRERGSCPHCNFKYVCDTCAAAMRQPDYVHLSWDKRVDLIRSQGEAK